MPAAPGQQRPALIPWKEETYRAQVDEVRVHGSRLVHPAPRGSGRPDSGTPGPGDPQHRWQYQQ
jgi:hypothetical protein